MSLSFLSIKQDSERMVAEYLQGGTGDVIARREEDFTGFSFFIKVKLGLFFTALEFNDQYGKTVFC